MLGVLDWAKSLPKSILFGPNPFCSVPRTIVLLGRVSTTYLTRAPRARDACS
ncbi:hypothetical protein A2U01_0068589 [Trifolium medium]|uniref:Uncharacterized protein n=1 Tax=Trifolium medium TaxID=97028 RepID=A0A392SEN2_9FABA|nr:hypothetical protein [Trifolium medium]